VGEARQGEEKLTSVSSPKKSPRTTEAGIETLPVHQWTPGGPGLQDPLRGCDHRVWGECPVTVGGDYTEDLSTTSKTE
jgi:hypothetical protein